MVDAAVALRPDMARDALSVVVTGKLVDQRKNEGVFYSTVLMARADEYSQPMPFEVRSTRQLGSRGEVVTVPCRVGGFFRRSYQHSDKQTGEVRTVRPIVVTLDAVDA